MPAHGWLVGSCLLVAVVGPVSFSRAQQPAETPQKRTERILDEKTTAEFLKTPFSDVLKSFAEKHGVDIGFSPEAMKAALVRNEPISVNLTQKSLRSVLHFLLDQYGLHYTLQPNGMLLIIPATKENLATRIESKPQLAAREKLTKVMKEEMTCQFSGTRLSDVIAFLSDQHDCTIAFDMRVLKERKISVREPVTVMLQSMPLETALRAVLVPFGLQAKIQNEMIFITAREVDRAFAQEINLELKARSIPQLAAELALQTRVPVVADFPAFAAAKIDLSTPIDVEVKKAPLRDILKALPVAVPPLQFVDRDGVILITPVGEHK